MNVPSSVAAPPARVVPLPGESLVSLLRRTAAAMGYEGPHRLRALIVDAGKVQANVNVLHPGPLLDILAVLLRQPPEMLLSMTVDRFAPTLVFSGGPPQGAAFCDSKTTLKYFAWGQFPVCPAGLRQAPPPGTADRIRLPLREAARRCGAKSPGCCGDGTRALVEANAKVR